MSACLKGHFPEEFVSTPKPLILMGKSKPVHYLSPLFFSCVHVCAIFIGLDIPTNTISRFSMLENQCHLRIYKDRLMARLLSRWKCLTNFYIRWRDFHGCILPRDFIQIFICTWGNVLFLYENFLFTDTEQKQRSSTSHLHLRGSRVSSGGCNSDGTWTEFSSPS